VVVRDTLAYLADHSSMRIIDISDPFAPTQVGVFGGYYIMAVVVNGNYAYVAGGGSWQCIDISNPAVPSEMWFDDSYDTGINDVAVSGDLLYVAWEGGVAVFWVDTTWTEPVENFGQIYMSYPVRGLTSNGNYVYAADGRGGLRVLHYGWDLEEHGYYDGAGFAEKVAVNGCLAYVADYHGISIYDISNFALCPYTMPCAPESLTVRYTPETEDLMLNWAPVRFDTSGAVLDVDYYIVMRTDEAEMDSIGIPVPPDTTFFIDSTATDTSVFYQVKAVKE
jgi:hypothetical protein